MIHVLSPVGFLLICFISVSGQHRFERFTTEHGLSQNTILCILQDNQGFLWIGTEDGLNRFDGYSFKTYHYRAGDSLGLVDDYVWTLLQDRQGNFWIGHEKGISLFDPVNQMFSSIIKEDGLYVISSFEDTDGTLWFGCGGNGLLSIDTERKISRYKNKNSDTRQLDAQAWELASNNILAIHRYHEGLLIGTRGAGIFYFVGGEFQRLNVPRQWDEFFTLDGIWSILIRDEKIYMGGGQGLGIFNMDFTQGEIFKADGRENSLSFSRITHLAFDDDMLWIATYGGGLNCFDLQTRKFSSYQYEPRNNHGISSNLMMRVLVDWQGNIWAGTWSGGLNKLSTHARAFEIHNPLNGLASPVITGVTETDSTVLAASLDGVVYSAQVRSTFPGSMRFTEVMRTWYINDMKKGKSNIWLALDGGGIGYWKYGQTKVETLGPIPGNKNSLSNRLINTVLEADSTLWAGTRGSGLTRIRLDLPYGSPGSVEHFAHENDNENTLPDNHVHNIHQDQNGYLWVGTINGLVRSAHPIQTDLTPDFLRLTSYRITSLLETEQGMYVGTDVGLFQIDKNSSFIPVEGFEGENIYVVLEDPSGVLWASTNNGLFARTQSEVLHFTTKDGLPTNEFNIRAGWVSASGRLWFGSVEGLVAVWPDKIQQRVANAPVWITSVTINKERQYELPKTLELNYGDRVIEFEFALLDYTNPSANRYAYKLEGFDDEWVYTSATRRLVTYTNLEAGNYTFRVKGGNSLGVWSDQEHAVTVIVHPPIWKTTWAYGLYSFAFVGLLFVVRRNIVNRERLKSKLQLEHVALEKLRELDEFKSRFFANISHEFRTPLTLILGHTDQLTNDAEETPAVESIRHNSVALLNLVNQLLDLSRIDAGKLELHGYSVRLVEFLKMHVDSFQSMADKKQIQLDVTYPEPGDVNIDPLVTEKIINNLLSNAMKYTPAGGRVSLKAACKENSVVIKVSDSGIGISSADQKQIFNRFYRASESEPGTGIGLALTQELVKLHSGTIEVTSEVGHGSTFTVTLPFLQGEYPRYTEQDHSNGVDLKLQNKNNAKLEALNSVTPSEEKPVALIVEDNEELKSFIAISLAEAYHVLTAGDGETGMQQALKSVPDVVITDWMMPSMSGKELCRKLKAHEATSHIPVILLTARAGLDDRLEGLDTGADDYLTKPFDMRELQSRIQNLVQQRKLLREKFSKEGLFQYRHVTVSSLDNDFIKRLYAILEENFHDSELSVDELSRKMGVSRVQLHRKLTALSGYAPGELLREFRLQRAADLLRQKAGNVSEIAFRVGFENLSYFTKVFKQKFQVTPSEYFQ